MRLLDAWRVRYGFALLLLVHCRKPVPGVRFSIHDLFGSSAYVRGAEVVLGLQRVSDGYGRLHFLKDRDGDLPVGFGKTETMPLDACQHFYRCEACGEWLRPKPGDCCVFCSYADVVCPPRQLAS